MDSCNEIKCWNRPKRTFDFGYELNSSTQISPRNTSSISCVSAITFDDSTHFMHGPRSNNAPISVMKENDPHSNADDHASVEPFLIPQKDNMKNHDYTIMKCLEKNNDNERVIIGKKSILPKELPHKGSLYSRITTGYIGTSNENDETEISSKDKIIEIEDISIEAGNKYEISDKNSEYGEYNAEEKETEASIVVEEENGNSANEEIHREIMSTSNLIKEQSDSVDISQSQSQSMNSSLLNNSYNEITQADQWREVHDHRTGRIYFYNRRTRESKWSLPANAILLGEKRKINDKGEITLSNSPTEISITTDSTRSNDTNEDTQERCKNPIHIKGDYGTDESSVGEDESKFITEQNRKSFQSGKKQTNFFPTDSEQQSGIIKTRTNEEECFFIEENNEMLHNHESIGDHVESIKDFVFCIFCGMKIQDSSNIIGHMSTCCPRLKNNLRKDQICKIIYDAFTTMKTLVEEKDTCTHFRHNEYKYQQLKENVVTSENGDDDNTEVRFVVEHDETMFSTSDEEDTIMDYSLNCSFHQNASYQSKILVEEVSQSTCPFCSKSFQRGSELSKHLLRCNARQSSSKKRTKRYDKLTNKLNGKEILPS